MSELLNKLFWVMALFLKYIQMALVFFFGLRKPVKGNLEDNGQKFYYTSSHPRYDEVEVSLLKGEKYFLDEAAALKDGWTEAPR